MPTSGRAVSYTPGPGTPGAARREPHAGPTKWLDTRDPGSRTPTKLLAPACTRPGLPWVHPRARLCIRGVFGIQMLSIPRRPDEVIGLAEVRDPGQGPIELSDEGVFTQHPGGMSKPPP